ncbi:MAG: type IV secretion system DNA-binding domain-containing protein, partial [Flammeovirgaceae bacterium]|nr:type IV secretion system DNA-binding domain-containing protein [Flammeovirgaceae bacterium]
VNSAYHLYPTLPLKFVCPAQPNFSHRVNPIHPDYLKKFDDVNTLSNALISNLGDYNGSGNRIFLEIAEAALAGVIWRTKESYPECCNLAHVSAILMTKSFEELFDYIKASHYASLLAKPLLDSADTDRQLAAIMTTLSNAFRKIVSPELFAIFSGHDLELAINHPDHLCALNIINHPKYDAALTPFLATLTKCVLMQMAERHRHPSVFILDEAATIKVGDLDKVLKTLRSYNIAVVLGIQDKIDGVLMYGEQKFLSIMANLNAKIIGKANDPSTMKYYESLFEIIREKRTSVSRSAGLGTDTRLTTTFQDRKKHYGQEFNQLAQGQAFVFDEKGANRKVHFDLLPVIEKPLQPIYNWTPVELKNNFDQILATARQLC